MQVLEGLINNLLHDIPLPSPGRSVRFWCLGEAVSLSIAQCMRKDDKVLFLGEDVGAAGGVLLIQAGDRSGKPPEAGPVSDGGGLPYIFNRVKNV